MSIRDFISDTKDYVEGRRAKSTDDFADFISKQYESLIKSSAKDMVLGNNIMSTNSSALGNALASGFASALSQSKPGKAAERVITNALKTGLMTYWAGAQLSMVIPPPGAVSVVSNIVISPGSVPPIPVGNTSDSKRLILDFVSTFIVHLLSVQILTTGVSATGAPIVLPITGIRVI